MRWKRIEWSLISIIFITRHHQWKVYRWYHNYNTTVYVPPQSRSRSAPRQHSGVLFLWRARRRRTWAGWEARGAAGNGTPGQRRVFRVALTSTLSTRSLDLILYLSSSVRVIPQFINFSVISIPIFHPAGYQFFCCLSIKSFITILPITVLIRKQTNYDTTVLFKASRAVSLIPHKIFLWTEDLLQSTRESFTGICRVKIFSRSRLGVFTCFLNNTLFQEYGIKFDPSNHFHARVSETNINFPNQFNSSSTYLLLCCIIAVEYLLQYTVGSVGYLIDIRIKSVGKPNIFLASHQHLR